MTTILVINWLCWMAVAFPLNSHVCGQTLDKVQALRQCHTLIHLRPASLVGGGGLAILGDAIVLGLGRIWLSNNANFLFVRHIRIGSVFQDF